MNASCIKTIKSAYSAHRGSKTVRKKGMNEYLEAEKEASVCEAVERVAGTTEKNLARKPHQAVVKHPHPSSSTGRSSRKKARREYEVEVPLQGSSHLGLGSTKSEEEEEVAPLLIRSQCGRGPATSKGIEVTEGLQPEASLAPLTTLGERAETQPGSPSIMMSVLKVVESSLTTGLIGRKAPVAEVSLV